MTENPHLLHEAPLSWRLDPQTRELGRRGVAKAREALAEAARRQDLALTLPAKPRRKPGRKPASPAPPPAHRSAA
jgi:hypothetical protein